MNLNIDQNNAVEYISGPCLVLAGAGSGKTRVVISKIVYLIYTCKILAKKIIAITFTNKSAQEMKLQLMQRLDINFLNDITIATFHSLGLRIIKSEILSLNIDSNFSLFDQEDKINILKNIVDSPLKKNNDFIYNLSLKISNWKNKLITPLQAQYKSKNSVEKKFADYYNLYQIYLKDNHKLDLDDLIFIPTMLLKMNKDIRLRWQKKIQYLLVDEYQDTNFGQYNFIKLLNSKNFTFVGDDDQSIYSWRGAEPKNLLFLKVDYPNLKIFKLEWNYRSSGRILKVANKLISNNLHLFKKKLVSKSHFGIKIKVLEEQNEEDEALRVVKEIIAHYKKNKTNYSDYAILYRGNYQSKVFENIFIKNNIPYNIKNQTHFLKFPEISILINYLKFILNPNDDFYFLKIINTPNRKIGNVTLSKLKSWAVFNKISLYNVCIDIKNINILNTSKSTLINEFVLWTKKSINIFTHQPSKMLSFIIKSTNYEQWLKKNKTTTKQFEAVISRIQIFLNLINELLSGSNASSKMTLPEVIEYLILFDDVFQQKKTSEKKGVHLMTLHASKGLEFAFVFIVGCEEGILPHYSSISQNNIEEERRLIYVGITRAKKELILTLARKRCNCGFTITTKPSRFLFELPSEDLIWINKQKISDEKNNKMHINIKKLQLLRLLLKQQKNK